MIEFYFDEQSNNETTDILEYIPEEQSVSFYGRPPEASGGVLINDIAVDFNKFGKAVFLSGLFPMNQAVISTLAMPSAIRRSLKSNFIFEKGVYHRVGEKWPVFKDRSSRLLCLGSPELSGETGLFLPGVILVLRSNLPVALWIKDLKNYPF